MSSFPRQNGASRDSGFSELEPEYLNTIRRASDDPPPPNKKPTKSRNVVTKVLEKFENIAVDESQSKLKAGYLDRKKSFSYLFGKGGGNTSKGSSSVQMANAEHISKIQESIGNEYEEVGAYSLNKYRYHDVRGPHILASERKDFQDPGGIKEIADHTLYENLSVDRLDNPVKIINNVDKHKKILSLKLQELITTEKNHVEKLSDGIEIYIKTVQNLDRNFFPNIPNVPTQLSSEYLAVLSSIEEMHVFHKQKLLPSLIACHNDLFNVAHLFHTYFTDDSFYIYIRYACGRSLIENLVEKHKNLFMEIARASNDRMGMSFFMDVPFERLRQYKLLFEDIYKVLQKDESCSKDLIRAYFRLKERLSEHMRTFNDALHLRQIENFDELIDWSHVGQFKMMGEFMVKMPNIQRFKSKAFLFDRNIIITKILEDQKLEIMDFLVVGNIQYINTIVTDHEFEVVTAGNRDIQFSGEAKIVREWIKFLTSDSDRDTLSLDMADFSDVNLLKSLRKIENHFKHFNLDSNLLNLFPKNIHSLDMTFQQAYVRVIEYHCNIIIPALEEEITSVTDLCYNVQKWLRDPEFMIYKKYAYLAAIIMNYFQTAKISNEHDPERIFIQLEPLIQAPLKHIKRYQRFFTKIMARLTKMLNVPENIKLLKIVAETTKDLNNFAKAVQANYQFKNKFIEYDFGMIQYSDLVTETQNSEPFRLVLLQKAIVAINLENDENNDDENESFQSIKWSIPYTNVKFEYCDVNRERIVIISKSPHGRFPVIFRSIERRKEFLKLFVGYF